MQSCVFLLWLIAAPFLVANAHFGHSHRREANAPELGVLFQGNQQFKEKMQTESPTLLTDLTENGQEPEFMFIGCSDSRVSEGTVFNANPGTLFTERNIANQFVAEDANAQSVVAYAVSELHVQHIIVMGHYGCGGVAAAIATPPEEPLDAANTAVQNWIAPIRALYQNSTRAEIVSLREKNAALEVVEEPEPEEPGFRALVEENVKVSVQAIARSTVIQDHFAALAQGGGDGETLVQVFIHGWVYDIANGEIQNLGISVGPPGVEIPSVPFAPVTSNERVLPLENTSEDLVLVCQKLCKAKRNFL
ncbi:carbonic anhydrase [Armillaria novae-zelandiae]|uniref:Carbonic anhydrase n=1 Tax=Armillaria novae-zelandiae TaxID=153914 RepID=A0AA39UIV1_9AGAR|nr:carbonic anhydrase [Armillaria novae-zelandiae]